MKEYNTPMHKGSLNGENMILGILAQAFYEETMLKFNREPTKTEWKNFLKVAMEEA